MSRVGTRLNDWKTKPTRRRRIMVSSVSSRRVISVSPSHTRPLEAESSPAMMCMSVDLPEPLGPMIAVNSPRRRPIERSSSAVTAVLAVP